MHLKTLCVLLKYVVIFQATALPLEMLLGSFCGELQLSGTFTGDDSAGRVPPKGGEEFRGGWVWLRREFEDQGSHSRTVLSKMGLPFLKIGQEVPLPTREKRLELPLNACFLICVLYYIITFLM